MVLGLPSDPQAPPVPRQASESMNEQQRETEDDEQEEGTSDLAPMLPQRPSDGQAPALTGPGWLGLVSRGPGTLLPRWTLAGHLLYLLHLLLPVIVFFLALLPAAATVYLGFLCHSRVHPAPGARCRALLSDRSSAALIVLGLLALPPLLALASATRARLARRLRSLLPPPARSPGPRRAPGAGDEGLDGEAQLCAWV